MSKNFLAIIPARGGSKRLPRKNLLPLNGKPLISWTIEAAKKSRYIDEIVATSDDEEILEIAKKESIKTIKRPDFLATDTASSIDVLIHAIENMPKFDYIILLQPTSPLRNEKHIDEAVELLFKKKADAVVSVCKMEYSPLWSNTLLESLDMSSFLKDEVKGKRGQDLPTYYRLNGAIYICKTDKFLEQKSLFLDRNIFGYIMDKKNSIDIDEAIDFTIAQCIIKKETNV